jgi:hypothetical protein
MITLETTKAEFWNERMDKVVKMYALYVHWRG